LRLCATRSKARKNEVMAGEIARAYHEATKHSYESIRRHLRPVTTPSGFTPMEWDNRPYPFKIYEGLQRLPLPKPATLGVSALEALVGAGAKQPVELDLGSLGRLLSYGAGLRPGRGTRGRDFHFRTYASAGALYPVEVYLTCEAIPGLPAGVYHFDPSEPALVKLREGDHRGHQVRAAAEEPALSEASVILTLTGIPWRTCWKYSERGYRHLFWDAGMIVANLLPLSSSAGWPCRLLLGFVDSEVEALLDLERRKEFPLLMLAVGDGSKVGVIEAPPEAASFEVRPLSRREIEFPAITEVNDAGHLSSQDQVERWRTSGHIEPRERKESTRAEQPKAPHDSLERVIKRRGSARYFGAEPIPTGVLSDILERATGGIPTDYAPEGSRRVEIYLIANAVEGLEPGAYVWDSGDFRLLRRGNLRREAGYLCLEQPLGATAAATLFLMADLGSVFESFGDRGYRAAQLEAGTVGGKIYLGAYSWRWGATGLTFYDDEVTKFFSPDASGKSCMLVIAVGETPRLGGLKSA
jgi:SagB-type dehydrogenase family enzyme